MSINSANVSGHLTRDSELKSTQSGVTFLNFCVAVNDRRKNPQTGEWQDYANFIDVVLFGGRAEWMARDLHKGKLVFVSGKLRYTSWEKDGERRSRISIVADEIDYERPPREQQNSYGSGTPQQPMAATPPQGGLYDENIPF